MTLEERKAEVYEDELAALAYQECVYLESINDLTIDGPEAGLLAYVENEDTTLVELAITREDRPLTLRYEFVD